MIKIGTYRTLADCDQARMRLTGSGIACEIRNEYGSRTAGAGPLAPLPFANPELWVLDDARTEEARVLLGQGDADADGD